MAHLDRPVWGRRRAAWGVAEIEGGKITATRHYFDLMTILQQVGALEQTGATA
jgi:limonene-1,2-epoxide hydrolase